MHIHALLALANLFAVQFGIDDQNLVQTMVAHMTHIRFRMRTIVPAEDEFAWYLGQTEDNQELKTRVHFLVTQLNWDGKEPAKWPADTYFHPLKGLVSLRAHDEHEKIQSVISPTIPFAPHAEIPIESPLQSDNRQQEHIIEEDTFPATVKQSTTPSAEQSEPISVTCGFAPHGHGHFKVHFNPTWQ